MVNQRATVLATALFEIGTAQGERAADLNVLAGASARMIDMEPPSIHRIESLPDVWEAINVPRK